MLEGREKEEYRIQNKGVYHEATKIRKHEKEDISPVRFTHSRRRASRDLRTTDFTTRFATDTEGRERKQDKLPAQDPLWPQR
jgi:hypothetical protein